MPMTPQEFNNSRARADSILDDRLVTVSDLTSTIKTDSEEDDSQSRPTTRKQDKKNEPRLKTDHITIQVIAKTLNYLPFYSVLTPSVRHYIAERVSVESYLPMERVEMLDPLKALDFIYVASGQIEFLLESIINPQFLQGS